jgi:hypothetical protein
VRPSVATQPLEADEADEADAPPPAPELTKEKDTLADPGEALFSTEPVAESLPGTETFADDIHL